MAGEVLRINIFAKFELSLRINGSAKIPPLRQAAKTSGCEKSKVSAKTRFFGGVHFSLTAILSFLGSRF
ncbi:MAG: hypothetical protein U0T31_09955 [Chitinophagales bacterium]